MSGGTVTVTEFLLTQEMEQQFIEGVLVKGDWDDPIDVLNPSNNETIFQLFLASDVQVEKAVTSCWREFCDDSWKKMTALERGKLITKLATLMCKNAESLARLEAINTGIPIRESHLEAASSARHFEYFAGWAGKNSFDYFNSTSSIITPSGPSR